jgi:hypothetical protein
MYAGLYIASMLYDNLDGLKIGLDTSLLKFSRATLNYYQKRGYVTGRDTEADIFDEMSDAQDDLASFTHYMNMLERNFEQLGGSPPLAVANHLIASSIDLIFTIIDVGSEAKLDRGDAYESYLRDAYHMEQKPVDEQTVVYIEMAIDALKAILPPQSVDRDLENVKNTLAAFKDVQARAHANEEQKAKDIAQELADHLFAQAFQQLLSLMSANRHILMRKRQAVVGLAAAAADR